MTASIEAHNVETVTQGIIAHVQERQLDSELWKATMAFTRWLEREGYASYDPYDIWGTRYGLWSRRIYYRQAILGIPLIVPILLVEMLCPRLRQWFVKKQRYPTADAQLALASLNLYDITHEKQYLENAEELGRDLLESSIPGYSGHCWGYPFDWEHQHGLWQKDTPVITATPYCFEAFLGLFDVTEKTEFLETAGSIAQFVHKDLDDTPTSADAAAGSYSPHDRSQVINASAYRAMVLFEAAHRFDRQEYRETAQRNLNFILQSQREDGAWLYALDSSSQKFIDHFHTCFVLKSLWKLNRRLRNAAVTQAISKGFNYYRRELFTPDGLPKSFAVKPRTQIVRLETYNFAEAITLGALLRDEIPEAYETARRLAQILCQNYQLPDGHFVTRVYLGGFRHKLAFLRWPQAQLFYALTNLLMASSAAAPQGDARNLLASV